MRFALNEQTKHSVEEATGIPYDDIVAMDIEELQERICKRVGKKKLDFNSDDDPRMPGMRGSIYWSLGRWFSFNKKKMDKHIEKLCKNELPAK
ncbi:MAG: hypothetical protein LBO71_02755 [Prevotellaceae bacterium]|jgi:hypothetical protein|nr:hypothetical protein [Prevotellaceae bacterium]